MVAFVVTTTMGLNLGAVALVGVLVVGVWALGLPPDELPANFPGDVFGVFTVARNNGT